MLNRWLLLTLLCMRINDLVKVHCIEVKEYREIVILISDIQEYYKVSSVFISYPSNDESIETSTLLLQLIRQFSGKKVMSLTLNYTSLVDKPHHGHIKRPLYVVLLDTFWHVEQFRQITSRCEMSYPFWLLIFTKPIPEFCGSQVKIVSNFFHLTFDTEMIVKCYRNSTVTEWYAHEDRTIIEELAAWDMHTGLTLKSNVCMMERRNLQGKVLDIATLKVPSIVTWESLRVNFFSLIFSELGASLNFEMKVTHEELFYGMYNKTTDKWSGIVGRLHAKEVDFGIAPLCMTEQRLDIVDFTYPIMLPRTRLYVRKPDDYSYQWSAYFRVFHVKVWIILKLLYSFTVLVITFIRLKSKEQTLSTDHISENYLCVWSIYCQQGMPKFPTAQPMRIAYFFIYVSSYVLLAIYSAFLVSCLTLTNPSLPFNDFEQFVEDGSYKLITTKESSHYEFFASSTDEVVKKMMNMMGDKETLPTSVMDAMVQTCNEKVAFYGFESIQNQVNFRVPCNLVPVSTERIDSLGMPLSKKSPYKKIINYHLLKLRSAGIITRLYSKIYMTTKQGENKFTPVSLKSIKTILALLTIGALISLIILIIEVISHHRQLAKQNRKLYQITKIPMNSVIQFRN